MKIYLNSKYLSKLKNFQLRQGNNFLCRLIGVSLEEDGKGTLDVYPVYRAIGIHNHPGQVILSFPWFQKEILISFSGRGIETLVVPADRLQPSDVGKEQA